MKIELEYVSCDSCGIDRYNLLFKARDYRFGRKEEYSVVKCDNCGLIYINPRPTTESISKLYESDYTPEDKSFILPQIETLEIKRILKKIWHRINGQYYDEVITKVEGRILDIGCGNGHLLLPLKHKGCEVYGVETNPKSVSVCNELGLKVFRGILKGAKFPDEFFDIVILSQVIEHLSSPKNSLKEIRRILKPGGRLYIFCPNAESYLAKFFGKYWHGWHIPFHFYAFADNTIRNLAHKVSFRVEKISAITPDHFFTVSLKCYITSESNSEIRPIDRNNFIDSFIFRVVISPFFRILDFILKGKGDCLKVALIKNGNVQISQIN